MAKYQRNLALSLVRTRNAQLPPSQPTMGTVPESETYSSENAAAAAAAAVSALPPPPPLPLLRNEIAGLRGGTTREGRRLEDWHPESLVALWCTSLMVGRDAGKGSPRSVGGNSDGVDGGGGSGGSGGGWERGRARILSILRWVSKDSEQEADGGVMAGTVVPFLAHGGGGGTTGAGAQGASEGSLGKLKACFASYFSGRLQDELGPEDERDGANGGDGYQSFKDSGPSVRRLPHASTRHFLKGGARNATPASARDVADTAAAAGVPLRLLNLSGAELSALSALLDEALGQDIGPLAAHTSKSSMGGGGGGAAAGDNAAALFSSVKAPVNNPPSPSSPDLGGFRKTLAEPTVAPAVQSDECASVFLLARGLRARLGRGGGAGAGGKSGETGMASSAALAMLLAPSGSQKDVLEMVCPRSGGVGVATGTGLTWGDARAMLLPLWVRDVSELQRVAEVVAANTFLQDRDIMAVRGVAWRVGGFWSRRHVLVLTLVPRNIGMVSLARLGIMRFEGLRYEGFFVRLSFARPSGRLGHLLRFHVIAAESREAPRDKSAHEPKNHPSLVDC